MHTLDGRYQVTREVSRSGYVALYQVTLGASEGMLYWFDVHSPEARTAFHRYRNALKALETVGALPQGIEISANPGRYFVFWPRLGARPPRKPQPSGWARALEPFAYAPGHLEMGEQGGQLRVALLDPLASMEPPTHRSGARVTAAPSPSRLRSWVGWAPGLLLGAVGLVLGLTGAQRYLNPPTFTMPGLLGQTSQQARESLRGFGARLEYTEGSDLEQPAGVVIGQEPEAVTQIKPGRRVMLVLNNPKLGVVGQVEGRSLEDARASLQALGYRIGEVASTYSSLPQDLVLASSPPSGTPLSPSTRVNLLVSAGPPPEPVPPLPDLVGLSLEGAQSRLAAGNWKVKLLQVPAGAAGNTVLSQEPAAGSLLGAKGTVTLTVSLPMNVVLPSAAPFLPETLPAPDPPANLQERRIPLSIEPIPVQGQRVRLVLTDAVGERVLFDEVVPDEFVFEADQGLLVSGSAVIELYVGDQLLRQWNHP